MWGGGGQKSTLRRSAVHHRPRTSHSHHYLESVIKLMCMLLVCGRKRIQRENPHRHQGTRKVYIEKNKKKPEVELNKEPLCSEAALQTTALPCRQHQVPLFQTVAVSWVTDTSHICLKKCTLVGLLIVIETQ